MLSKQLKPVMIEEEAIIDADQPKTKANSGTKHMLKIN